MAHTAPACHSQLGQASTSCPNADRRHAGKTDVFGLDNTEGDPSPYTGIDGIATGFKNLKRSLGSQVVTGSSHVPGSNDAGTIQ
jgi:hypothetical protein